MVVLSQTSDVRPVNVAEATRVPVDYRLTITNPLPNAVTLKAVELETVGFSGGYLLKRVRHSFDQNVAAGGTSTVDLRAWVQPLQTTELGHVTSAVMVHGIARFDSDGKTIRKAFSARLGQSKE